MKETALLFGALLIAMGVFAYNFPVKTANADQTTNEAAAGSGETSADDGVDEPEKKKKTSVTALIPAVFGVLFVILGLIGFLGDGPRKHAMHAAATVGLLGAIAGLGRGLMKIGTLFGDDPTLQRATLMTLIMGALCLVYVVLSIRSFIAARKAREAAEAASA